jgi:3,4-dihydroxy 2-butanone 4-phosphate synthase/GTP cyclohydrolase II
VAAEVHEHTEPFLGDAAHRRVELVAAVAAHRAEDVTGHALVVHAHQRRLVRLDVTHHQRDVFGSLRCDCGPQLRTALERISAEGLGVVVYLRGHEGRGIGIGHKLQAYNLQDQGHDTVDANVALGLPVDSREYGIGAQILVDLGITTMRLLTNNPAKYGGLDGFGLDIVERVPLQVRPNPENIAYLRTKRERMGHLLDGLDDVL